ncbi:uncharacterized protein PHALS_06761 [Plasmopara halstedii]|uniref:Uncharacterized protein n=1 Tax=Plasmopara halstedii TaxID=4781 RepID=A0A0N7L860_PLAHL|nr:uncharacterized protein PHALS_06761 [Plasmopara halstedii]CEG48971.1 hypothetical protein PHALS_06761 [Plasmopara halstedii]|eukprot:XP_024585340.1 hypothetical protein PHALS_06761 [Plasmopara halstedii]
MRDLRRELRLSCSTGSQVDFMFTGIIVTTILPAQFILIRIRAILQQKLLRS